MHDREQLCAAQHFGYWMVSPKWMNDAVAAYRSGMLARPGVGAREPRPMPTAESGTPKTVHYGYDADGNPKPLYTVDETGVALIGIQGQITKGESSFGGTSSVRTRRALRTAERDQDATGIMLSIDSPGGTVSGQYEFAEEIYRIRKAGIKPIHTYASSGMHSAALWAGVQAGRVTAGPMTEIGSIGTVMAVYDYSEAYEKEGIKAHVISTGEMKGAGAAGTEITDVMLEEWRSRVEEVNQFFLDAVKRGRGMSASAVKSLADGRDWMAKDAAGHGLIDGVESFDQAMNSLRKASKERRQDREARSRRTARMTKLSELGA